MHKKFSSAYLLCDKASLSIIVSIVQAQQQEKIEKNGFLANIDEKKSRGPKNCVLRLESTTTKGGY
jgi:hypothetical protein